MTMASLSKRRQADPVDELRANLAMADAERADAVRQLQDLMEARPALLADADDETLRQHDDDAAKARRRIERADAQHARIAAEVPAAEHEAEQARRREVYARGAAAMGEASTLMALKYPALAQALADLLKQVADLRAVARAANEALPDGAEPLNLNAEPFNGRYWLTGDGEEIEVTRLVHRETGEFAPPEIVSGPMFEQRRVKMRRHVPSQPAIPHRPIADFVNLPGLSRDEYVFAAVAWGQPRV